MENAMIQLIGFVVTNRIYPFFNRKLWFLPNKIIGGSCILGEPLWGSLGNLSGGNQTSVYYTYTTGKKQKNRIKPVTKKMVSLLRYGIGWCVLRCPDLRCDMLRHGTKISPFQSPVAPGYHRSSPRCDQGCDQSQKLEQW